MPKGIYPRRRTPPEERFWGKVHKTETCWLWTGAIAHGYAIFTCEGNQLAHRYAYKLLVGPIPEGMQLDHLCRVRHCVNPEHLEPVTNRENVLRGEGPTAVQARKTHCKHGHPFDEGNTYWLHGHRICRECRNRIHRKWYARKKLSGSSLS